MCLKQLSVYRKQLPKVDVRMQNTHTCTCIQHFKIYSSHSWIHTHLSLIRHFIVLPPQTLAFSTGNEKNSGRCRSILLCVHVYHLTVYTILSLSRKLENNSTTAKQSTGVSFIIFFFSLKVYAYLSTNTSIPMPFTRTL
jgi:hypothetical protein